MGGNDPGCGGGQFEPQGHFWQIYIVNHYALLQTKYRSCMFHGFRRFFKKLFPIIHNSKSMEGH